MRRGRKQRAAKSSTDAPGAIRLIRKPELCALLGVSYASIFSWMRQGKFPPPHIISPISGRTSRVAWFESEVQQWLRERPQRVVKPPPAKKDAS